MCARTWRLRSPGADSSCPYASKSTQRQGRSGLGLEAQQKAVRDYLNGGDWRIVSEYTEVESGKRRDRPKRPGEAAGAFYGCAPAAQEPSVLRRISDLAKCRASSAGIGRGDRPPRRTLTRVHVATKQHMPE